MSMILTGAERPENLTGTNGEAALHMNPVNIRLSCPLAETVFHEEQAEVFITSASLLLYCASQSSLVTIQYPDIVLHAACSSPESSLYMQIENEELGRQLLTTGEWHDGMFELFLIPIAAPDASSADRTRTVNELFSAFSTCASMHPSSSGNADDDQDTSEFDDALTHQLNDPNHHWITADTVDGQFDDADASHATNGHDDNDNSEDGPRKWRRTD